MRWYLEFLIVNLRIILVRSLMFLVRFRLFGLPRKILDWRVRKQLIKLYKQRIALQELRDSMEET